MELCTCVFIYTVRTHSTAVHSLTAVVRVLRLKSLCCPSLGQSCRMRGFNSDKDRIATQCSLDHYCKSSSWCVLHAIIAEPVDNAFCGTCTSRTCLLHACMQRPMYINHERMVSVITARGVRWTGLPHPLPFQRSSDSNVPDYLWLYDLHWSSDCGGVPSIRLPMLWLRSPSFHDQQLHTAIST